MHVWVLALTLVMSVDFATAQEAKPPVAPVRNVVDEYYGVKVNDPYRYMEKLDNPEVAGWFKAQAAYTDATLSVIPGRKVLLARLQELNAVTPALIRHVRRFPENRIYYEKQPAGENVFKLYVRNGFQGAERLLINPSTWVTRTNEHIALDWWEPSPDGRLVAFGISAAGSEQSVLHIVDTDSGKLLPDTIDRSRVGEISWAEDNRSMLHNRLQKVGDAAAPTEKYKNSRVYLHVLGRDPEDDPVVFGGDVTGVVAAEPDWQPFTVVTPGSHYLLGVFYPGGQKTRVIYKQPLAAWGTQNKWTKVVDLEDNVVGFAVHGDDLYLVSQRNASNRQLLVTKLSDPDLRNAKVLIPQGASVIEEITAASDALYVRTADAGSGKVLQLKYGSSVATSVPQPKSTSAWFLDANARVSGVVIGIGSWVQRDVTYVYQGAGATVETHLEPESPLDIRGLQVSEVRVKSYDGTPIPLTIISKPGLSMTGSNPTLLVGYGAYGQSMDPVFNSQYQPWFEHGGIWAIAHVRGGGEYGEEWHAAGKGLKKENTWKDLIACAQYLIEHEYTSPKRLGIFGGSAGGIMVGRAIEERPDLFAAAIDAVPPSDMIRIELSPNGPGNVVEFGTVKNRDGFDGLFKMSAYHQVRDGTPYPAVLITMGFNDSRVVAWQPAKLAARLQAATSSNKPVLLRVDYDAGHGMGSTERQRELETADELSFLFWQMGVPEFQPKELGKLGLLF